MQNKDSIAPNTFPSPNFYVDILWPLLKPEECKILMVFSRTIFGWVENRKIGRGYLSTTTIERTANMSRPTVIKHLHELLKHKIIVKVADNDLSENAGACYELTLDSNQIDLAALNERETSSAALQTARTENARKSRKPAGVVNGTNQGVVNGTNRLKEIRERNKSKEKEEEEPPTPFQDLSDCKKPQSDQADEKPQSIQPLLREFTEAYLKNYKVHYGPVGKAENIIFNKLKSVQGDLFRESDWRAAIENYFNTPRSKHTIGDLCSNFAVLKSSPLDRYGKPVTAETIRTPLGKRNLGLETLQREAKKELEKQGVKING